MTPDSPYDQKLASILSASAEVFAQKGYHNASIRDVSRVSGISLSGLYHYFESKEELLYLIQENALVTVLEEIESGLVDLTNPADRLRALMQAYLSYFASNMEAMKVLSHEVDSLGGRYAERINARKRRFTEILGEILKELNPESDIDGHVAVFGLFGMMNWIYTWYRPGRGVSVDRLVNDMSKIFLNGYLGAESNFALSGSEPTAAYRRRGGAMSRNAAPG